MATILSGCQSGSFAGAGTPATSTTLQRAAIVHSASLSITHRLGSLEGNLPDVAPALWMKFAPVIGMIPRTSASSKGPLSTNITRAIEERAADLHDCKSTGRQRDWRRRRRQSLGSLRRQQFGRDDGIRAPLRKSAFADHRLDGSTRRRCLCSKSNVYIEDIISSTGPGYIQVYAPGKTVPKAVLTANTASLWFDEALDASDKVFMVYDDPYNKGHVVEFPRGQNSPKALPMTLGFPGGITFDSAGHLLVVDQDARNVSVYVAPFTGKPVGTFALQADSVPCKFAQGKTLLIVRTTSTRRSTFIATILKIRAGRPTITALPTGSVSDWTTTVSRSIRGRKD